MILKDLDFTTWCKNHQEDHDSKWCRELYPYNVFRRITFCGNYLNIEQKINFNRIEYYATIRKVEFQENGRCRTTFDLSTKPASKTQAWKKRVWNTQFQIVYAIDGSFITVFTKKEDPSKEFVAKFMRGTFEKISSNKSIPISELLFRTLLLHMSEESFPGGMHNQTFDVVRDGIRPLPKHAQFQNTRSQFAPIYSINRELWVCYAFNEEKAHRVAFMNSDQCKRLLVVYCNPTYTKHHRCTFPNTEIVSLYEYSNLLSLEFKIKYEPQIKFLQNHLNAGTRFTIEELRQEIESPSKQSYEIDKSDLMEALGVMKIMPRNNYDTFYSLAAMNLVNAWISRKRVHDVKIIKEQNLFRNMYYFKTYLSKIISGLIENELDNTKVFIQENLTMVEIFGFQFSYHNIPKNDVINSYLQSPLNKEIIWEGKRLQPLAPLILHYARGLRQSEG